MGQRKWGNSLPCSMGWGRHNVNTMGAESVSCSVMSHSLRSNGLRLLCPWNSPGMNTGVGSHPLLPGIFLSQGWNLGPPACRWILYCLSYKLSSLGKTQGTFSQSKHPKGVFMAHFAKALKNSPQILPHCCRRLNHL